MDQWISLLCGAYAAAGCALPSSHIPKNFVALQRARRCGLRIAFVASNNTSISFPLQCVRRCGLRTAVLHPTAHHHRCLAMHDFFSIGLLVLIGLCFFYRLETSAPGLSGYYWYRIVCDKRFPLPSFAFDWTFLLMTRTKLASCCFVAARNCMRQQVLDHAESLPDLAVAGRSPQRHATLPPYYKVLLRTYWKSISPVLQSTTPYYKVLLQYYSVPQSTTPYSPYYKVLLQYCKVLLQFYKVLLQYYPVLQSTTKYYSSTTKYYSSTTKYYSSTTKDDYRVLTSTTKQYCSALLCTTKYLKKYYSTVLLYTTKCYNILLLLKSLHEMSLTLQGATGAILQRHQILCLTRKMIFMTDPCHIWNVIYNKRSNRQHPPSSPNLYLPRKRLSWLMLITHEMSFTMRGATEATLQHQQILCLPRKKNSHDWSWSHMNHHLQCAEQQMSTTHITTKYCTCHEKWLSWWILFTRETLFYIARSNRRHPPTSANTAPATKNDRPKYDRNLLKTAETSFSGRSEHDASMIREWSDHDPVSPQPAVQPRLLFALAASILYGKINPFALPLSFQISPRIAPAMKSDSWTSPNTAPATKNHSHDSHVSSSSQMKRYLQ